MDSPSPTSCESNQSFARRLFSTLTKSGAVIASLMSFPTVFVWMLGIWLTWHTWLALRGRSGWLPLATALMLLVVKLPPLTLVIGLFAVSLLVTTVSRYLDHSSRKSWSGTAYWMTATSWFLWGIMLAHWQAIEHRSQPLFLQSARPIVCLGDSLTEGFLPDKGYPDQLAEMLSVPVINLGFSGIATSQGRDQMDRVLKHQPQAVIIELGGHDFLKGHTRGATKANLDAMIVQCRDHGAEPILMEIPRGFMLDPYASLERQIAYEQDVELVADTWLRQIVLLSPIAPPGMWLPESQQLSDDGIHSNRRGSHRIAACVAESLRRIYGDQILASPTN